MERNDVLFPEYVSEHDHLYMTVGAPREGKRSLRDTSS